MEVRNLMKVDPGEPRISYQRSKSFPMELLTSLPEETRVLRFRIDRELRRVREKLCISRAQTPAPQALEQRPAEAKDFDIRELPPIRLGKWAAGIIHRNKEYPPS